MSDTNGEPFRRDCVSSEYQRLEPTPVEGERAEFYREVLECIADGVYCLNACGYVTFANPAAQRMTGWAMDDLRGRTQHSMVHHSHADGSPYPREACPIYAALRDGLVHRRDDEVFWRKDGSSFPVSYTSSPIFKEGKPDGAVVVFRDRSKRIL